MRYQLTGTGAIYHRHELGDAFPTVSLPNGELSQDSLELLGLVTVPDEPPPPLKPEMVQEIIVANVQRRLDRFAQERGYDNILSACTYAASSVPQFAQDGKTCVDARDHTWAALYELLAQVKLGLVAIPHSYEDVEPLLPLLVWPQ